MNIIPYKKEHAYLVLNQNIEAQGTCLYKNFEEIAKIWGKGEAYTLVIGGDIVFCGGIVNLDRKIGEAWMLVSPLFFKHIKTSYKVCKNKFNEMVNTSSFKRVQATVFCDFKEGQTFVKHLGMEKEGTLRAYGPKNEDVIMFARIL